MSSNNTVWYIETYNYIFRFTSRYSGFIFYLYIQTYLYSSFHLYIQTCNIYIQIYIYAYMCGCIKTMIQANDHYWHS